MNEVEHKINILKQISALFNQHHIKWIVGGSCMLYLRGIVDTFDDIDIMILEVDQAKATQLLSQSMSLKTKNGQGIYRTKALHYGVLDEVKIELLIDFAIVYNGAVYEFPVDVKRQYDTVDADGIILYLAPLDEWLFCYKYMDRPKKIQLIEQFLAQKNDLDE